MTEGLGVTFSAVNLCGDAFDRVSKSLLRLHLSLLKAQFGGRRFLKVAWWKCQWLRFRLGGLS